MPSIEIVLNGEKKQVVSSTVADLLDELALSGKKVAVELNKQIVPRGTYDSASLDVGDVIELVHFVGGG